MKRQAVPSNACRFVCSECGPRLVLRFGDELPKECSYCDIGNISNITLRPFGEREWLSCADWESMAQWVDHVFNPMYTIGTHRKFRLFAVACCSYIWDVFSDDCFREAVGMAEVFADGLATEDHLKMSWRKAHTAGTRIGYVGTHWAAINAVGDVPYAKFFPPYVIRHGVGDERTLVARWLLDIFGNPFRPITLDPSWLTSTVLALATGIYQEKAFDRMPILADALQDAGCDNDDVLNHCRQPGIHVKGCWVVDLLLNKK